MTQPTDTITANRFSITIDGQEIATFSELSGINAEIGTTQYTERNATNTTVSSLPGVYKPPTVTLKRGMTGSLELWAWQESARKGPLDAARRGCSLTMFNADGKPVARYWLEKAYPSKMELSGLKAGSTEVLMETATLTCEYVQRVNP